MLKSSFFICLLLEYEKRLVYEKNVMSMVIVVMWLSKSK